MKGDEPADVSSLPKRRVLKDILHYSAGNLAAQTLGMVSGFWVARNLSPADFGLWNAVSLVLTYGAFVDFGVLSAMGRDLPFLRGQGDHASAATVDGAARWATIGGGVVAAVLVALWALFVDESMVRLGLWIMAGALILQQAFAYHRIVLRGENLFTELSRLQVLLSTLSAVFAIVGVTVAGVAGRMAAALVSQGSVLAYALRRRPWPEAQPPDIAVARRLVREGMAITASSLVAALVTTVDRVMVLTFLGRESLGYLGFALLVTAVVSVAPQMANQVLYPRITFAYGRANKDLSSLRSFVLRPPVIIAFALPALIGPAYLLLPFVVEWLLPHYAPGITAMRIVIVGTYFLAIIGLTDYFLVTIGRLRLYALIAGLALSFNVVLDYTAIKLGYGIEGVAFAGTPLTYFLYSTMYIAVAISHYLPGVVAKLGYLLRLWFPLAYMLALLWLIETQAPSASTIESALLRVVYFMAGITPLAWFALICIMPALTAKVREKLRWAAR